MVLRLFACVSLVFLTGSAVRPRLDEAWGFGEPQNEDRAHCMRQDNLDIAGGDQRDHSYILREVYSPVPNNPQNDIYFLCEEFEIQSILAHLNIRRAETNEFEFQLKGDYPLTTDQGTRNVGVAHFVMKGFELVSGMQMADWAADFAANREVLRQGQKGSMTFALSGRVRAVQKRGIWEAELVTGSKKVDYFDLKVHRQWVIDKLLRSWGKLKELILQQLFELLHTAIPINLLAALHYLPFKTGLTKVHQDFFIEARATLNGGINSNTGELQVKSRSTFDVWVKPGALLDVLVKNFNVKEMAHDAVMKFFEDPETRTAFMENREAFAENLRQYRFVLSDSLLDLVAKAEHLDELLPLLLKEAEDRATDLLLRVLDPLVKAKSSGILGNMTKKFRAGMYSTGGWQPGVNNGLFIGHMAPRKKAVRRWSCNKDVSGRGWTNCSWDRSSKPLLQMDRSLLEGFGLRENLLEPINNAESCSTKMSGINFELKSLGIESGVIRNCRRSRDNKTDISWEVRQAEFENVLLGFPSVLQQRFEASGVMIGVDFATDGRVVLRMDPEGFKLKQRQRSKTAQPPWNKRPNTPDHLDGPVPVLFERPVEANPDMEKGIMDRFSRANMTALIDILDTKQNSVAFVATTYQDVSVDLSRTLGDVLAPRSRQDHGYVFDANLFDHEVGRKKHQVMAVLHCGFLRLFRWPLKEHGSDRLSPLFLVDIDLVSVMETGYHELVSGHRKDGSYCLEIVYQQPHFGSWLWSRDRKVKHSLCGPHLHVMRMVTAMSLQKVRFRDLRARQWVYGTHQTGTEQYLLKDGNVQQNLVQVMKDRAKHVSDDMEVKHFKDTEATAALAQVAQVDAISVQGEVHQAKRIANSLISKENVDDAGAAQIPAAVNTGSHECLHCRAEELLNLHWPPERFGNAVLRKAFPTKAIGNVYVVIQHLELVKFDLHGTLRRSEDTTFSLMLSGPDGGQAVVQMYVDGIDFAAPNSKVPGFVRAASGIDRVFKPMENSKQVGSPSSGGLQRGPLLVKFKMLVEFRMKDGHWEVKPGALSDVDISFGNGGVIEQMINTLIGIFGQVDQLLLESLWPVVANYLPEIGVQTLEKVSREDGQLAHHFKILAQCQEQLGDRCRSDKVDFFIKDLTNLDVAASKVFPMYLSNLSPEKEEVDKSVGLTLLHSYVSCVSEMAQAGASAAGPLKDMLGQAIISLGMQDNQRAQVNLSSQAVAPVQMLRCLLGDPLIQGLLPEEQKSAIKAAVHLHDTDLSISQVRLQRLRLPFSYNGKEDAIELSATLKEAKLSLQQSQGIAETVFGHVNLELNAVKGLVLRRITDGYPLLSVDLSPAYLRSFFQQISDKWAEPRNVRTEAKQMPDGKLDERLRRPRAQAAMSLDFQQLLVKLRASVGVQFSERAQDPQPGKKRQEHLQAQASLALQMTLQMDTSFWRSVLSRKQHDYGFVFQSIVGSWGLKANGIPKQAALLQISCDQVQIFDLPGSGPFNTVLYSKDIHDILMDVASQTPTFEHLGDKTCWVLKVQTYTWFADPRYHFCASVKDMMSVQEALHLQLTRLSQLPHAQVVAKAADEESTKATGVRFTGEQEAFGDSTWLRRYNAFDTSSWSPEIPAEYHRIQTPLERWQLAVTQGI